MSEIQAYEVWFTVTVSHPYFEKGKLPLTLIPQQQTACFFRRNGLLFKQLNQGVWCIYSEGKEVEPVEELCFEVKVQGELFYYVSNLSGRWKELHIPLPSGGGTYEWLIPVTEKYWECLVFVRQPQPPEEWVIRERRGGITFDPPEQVDWEDGAVVFRSCSTSMIPLQPVYPYRLQLVEMRKGRERILLEELGCPAPHNLSLKSKECLTIYIYL